LAWFDPWAEILIVGKQGVGQTDTGQSKEPPGLAESSSTGPGVSPSVFFNSPLIDCAAAAWVVKRDSSA